MGIDRPFDNLLASDLELALAPSSVSIPPAARITALSSFSLQRQMHLHQKALKNPFNQENDPAN